ncbi:hypothetical protein CTA1_3232 [Colletotrichum tanaceti]|uniref:Uncharacterized protein n=1 Tax=Colletotrichum tanaceti TaxID=1306861 RepID=A0A4U6X2R3_9PEZI|nr:hypothetical protein CTA1_3232 [Colletotrichum tanaceti]
MGGLLLAAHHLATVFRQLGCEWLSDRTDNVFALMLVSSLVSSVAAFTLRGFAYSLALLFDAMLSDDPQPVFSIMAFGKGVGDLAKGSITAGLLTKPVSWGYGVDRYESLVLLLGSSMLCPCWGLLSGL